MSLGQLVSSLTLVKKLSILLRIDFLLALVKHVPKVSDCVCAAAKKVAVKMRTNKSDFFMFGHSMNAIMK